MRKPAEKQERARLILLDIDHTVVNDRFEMTSNGLPTKIHEAQRRGYKVGLNSDRSFKILSRIARELGLNGLIIIERGNAIYQMPDGIPYHENNELLSFFYELKLEFISRLHEELPDLNIHLGDSEAFFHPVKNLMTGQECAFLMMSGSRKFSIGYNVFQKDHNQSERLSRLLLEQSSEILKKLFQEMAGTLPDLGIYDSNSACILHYPGTEKANATNRLIADGLVEEIHMIGDSTQDYLGKNSILRHYAVGNAQSAFGEVCVFQSEKPHTGGVIDIIDWIITH